MQRNWFFELFAGYFSTNQAQESFKHHIWDLLTCFLGSQGSILKTIFFSRISYPLILESVLGSVQIMHSKIERINWKYSIDRIYMELLLKHFLYFLSHAILRTCRRGSVFWSVRSLVSHECVKVPTTVDPCVRQCFVV